MGRNDKTNAEAKAKAAAERAQSEASRLQDQLRDATDAAVKAKSDAEAARDDHDAAKAKVEGYRTLHIARYLVQDDPEDATPLPERPHDEFKDGTYSAGHILYVKGDENTPLNAPSDPITAANAAEIGGHQLAGIDPEVECYVTWNTRHQDLNSQDNRSFLNTKIG